jgi:hypothetical protein
VAVVAPSQVVPAPVAVAPQSVVLLVDENQRRAMRNTFVFWELATLALGIYVGKKFFAPSPGEAK